MKITTALAIGLSLTGGLALTALAGSDEDARYAEYLRGAGKDPSMYMTPAPDTVVTPEMPTAHETERQRLNPNFVASSDRLEGCQNAIRRDWKGYKGRFCKVKPSLLPIYETVANETGIPVGLLYAVGEYETHNRATDMSDGGKSCGLHGWNTWRTWGFASLAECHNPEASVRKLAESYTKNGGAQNEYLWLRKHNGGPKRGPTLPVTAVYAERILYAAEHLYSTTTTDL